jgi:hypothetical protein
MVDDALHTYEFGKLKPVEITLRRREGRRRTMEDINQIKVHYMYIWKGYNEIPCTTIIN